MNKQICTMTAAFEIRFLHKLQEEQYANPIIVPGEPWGSMFARYVFCVGMTVSLQLGRARAVAF